MKTSLLPLISVLLQGAALVSSVAPTLAIADAAVAAGATPPLAATLPAPADQRVRELIDLLKLQRLAGESGYFAAIGQSVQKVASSGRPLAAQSQIYYLLTAELPVNYLHWLESDDTHVLIEGGPVDYFIFHPDGRVERVTLGRDLAAGQRPVVAVPGGSWKALRLHPGARFALIANILSPEWTPDRVKIGAGSDFVARFHGAAPWATPDFLRRLIGPNFLH